MEYVKTGIPGFDDLIDEGIPRGHTVLVSGGPGCGKTIFGLQFAYNGVDLFEEKSAYITVEESEKSLILNAKNFNWVNFYSYVSQNKLILTRLKIPEDFLEDFEESENKIIMQLDRIPEYVEKAGVSRLVLDSLSALSFWISNQAKLRWALNKLSRKLKDLGCTTFFISETPEGKTTFSAFGVEEFISDAIIKLMFIPPNRYIFIRKMRGVNHSKKVHPFQITSTGIVVNSREEVLWDSLRD
jgi:KaiC/GvpD/RAD55 family RecA-like ATPase